MRSFLRKEWILPLVWLIAIALQVFHQPLLVGADNPTQILSMFLLLFTAIMFAAFAVVRHADVLAETLGEPLGTLTLAVSMVTYSQGKTNILLGAVHLVLFATFIMLIFDDM